MVCVTSGLLANPTNDKIKMCYKNDSVAPLQIAIIGNLNKNSSIWHDFYNCRSVTIIADDLDNNDPHCNSNEEEN